MPEKYGRAHGEKVAFSESCYQLASWEGFHCFCCSCAYPDWVARAGFISDYADVSIAVRVDEDMLKKIVRHDRRPTLMMFESEKSQKCNVGYLLRNGCSLVTSFGCQYN
jgi:hypothetical protein